MDNDERLSALIGVIYDAALDPSLWIDVLRQAAPFVGGPAAGLCAKSAATMSGALFYDYGIDPHYRQSYFDEYIRLDPSTTGPFFVEIDQPIATTDLVPYDEFRATRFHQEWARPQGLVDQVTAVLDKSAMSAAMFAVFRHERDGVVDEAARRRMRLIVPHIRRAVCIGRLIDLKALEATTFADVLGGINAGMFLVDAGARVVHASAAGQAMLHAGDVLSPGGGRLVVADGQADAILRDVFAAAGSGDAGVGTKGIAVPIMARSDTRYVAHVLPLTSGARRRAGIAYAAVAAVFVREAALEPPSAPEVIAKSYKLTPTELRVLLAVVDVGGVPEVATALGIAETTVKTHLARLFAKTGATRQAELVKLVAGFASPLASGVTPS